MAFSLLALVPVNVSFSKLVDSIVCEMHKEIVHIVPIRPNVCFCAKTGESHLVQVNAKWVDTVKKNVQPEIVLQIFDDVGSVDILLHHIPCGTSDGLVVVSWMAFKRVVRLAVETDVEDFLDIPGYENTFALTHTIRLHNVGYLFFAVLIVIVGEVIS